MQQKKANIDRLRLFFDNIIFGKSAGYNNYVTEVFIFC